MLTTTEQQIETGTGEGGELLGINVCFELNDHRNQQYSVTAITNSSAGVAERYAYQAYGEPTILDASASVLSSSSISNRYTYTGREWDGTIGLYHFRARWMSGLTGRFLSRDPIGFEGSEWGLYEFVKASTLQRLDPTGEYDFGNTSPTPTPAQIAACKQECREKRMLFDKGYMYTTDIRICKLHWFRCVCKDRPDRGDRCVFEYMWCIWGVMRPKDPGEKRKPWPSSIAECDSCMRNCAIFGGWGCKKPKKGIAPEFEDEVWPDGMTL